MSHLLKRIDLSAEQGYTDFSENDKSLENQPIKRMSNLTERILSGIDYQSIKKQRKEKFPIPTRDIKKKTFFQLNYPMIRFPWCILSEHMTRILDKNLSMKEFTVQLIGPMSLIGVMRIRILIL
jgi:hypothetical protein